jgi:hypothetical protein
MPDPVSIHEQILAEIETRLGTVSVSGSAVLAERNRDEPEEIFPCLILDDGSEELVEQTNDYEWHRAMPQIRGFATGATTSAMGTARNLLKGAATKALFTDATLGHPDFTAGGLAIDMQLGPDATLETVTVENATPCGGFALSLVIDFWIKPGDPFTAFSAP